MSRRNRRRELVKRVIEAKGYVVHDDDVKGSEGDWSATFYHPESESETSVIGTSVDDVLESLTYVPCVRCHIR